MPSERVSIVILCYNAIKHIDDSLTSVLKTKYPHIEIVVVDNASKDATVAVIKEKYLGLGPIKLIQNPMNTGITGGRNTGVQHSSSKYVAILDVDVIVEPEWLDGIIELLENDSSVGLVMPKLLNWSDKTVHDTKGTFIDTIGFAYIEGHLEKNTNREEEHVLFSAAGPALIVRKDVFEKIGGFDDDYFLLFEETDLCWRIWLAGYKVVYYPKSVVYHNSQKTYGRSGYFPIFHFYRNRLNALIKNLEVHNLIKALPAHLAVLALIYLRELRNHDVEFARAISDSVLWNIKMFRRTVKKRLQVVQYKKITNDELVRSGIIHHVDLSKSLGIFMKGTKQKS